jgi:hypothetical protein
VGKFISDTQSSPKFVGRKRLIMAEQLHKMTGTGHTSTVRLGIDNVRVRGEELGILLDSIDMVLCTTEAKAGCFRTREVESSLIFLGKGGLLGTKRTDDMEAILWRNLIKIFEGIGGFWVSLRVFIVSRGSIGRLKLNGEEVWLLICACISGVLAEVNNVSMENVIVYAVIRERDLLTRRGRVTFGVPNAGFSVRIQRGRFRDRFVILINNSFDDGNLLRTSWML